MCVAYACFECHLVVATRAEAYGITVVSEEGSSESSGCCRCGEALLLRWVASVREHGR